MSADIVERLNRRAIVLSDTAQMKSQFPAWLVKELAEASDDATEAAAEVVSLRDKNLQQEAEIERLRGELERESINVPAAKALISAIRPGCRVIYRDAFRWKDPDGSVIPNHYEMFSATSLANDFGHDLVLDLGFAAIIREAAPPAPAMPNGVEGLAYAQRLAVAIWSRNYREVSPQWEVCGDLMGVLSQIDNMVSGMSAADNRDAAGVVLSNDGTSEAQFIADGENLNCPRCGGSGHVGDTPTAAPAGEAVASRSDIVPGVMRCAKCSFQLVRNTMYVRSGTIGPGGSETEPCPNGCGPLWPVTWQQWATEGWEQAERYFEELHQLRTHPPAAEVRE